MKLPLLLVLQIFLILSSSFAQSIKQDHSFAGKGTFRFSNGRYNEVKAVAPSLDKNHFFVLIESLKIDSLRDIDIVILKLSANGKPDPSFGNKGQIAIDFYGMDISRPGEINVLEDGKLLIAGDGASFSNKDINLSCLIKILPNGTVDRSFGKEGTLPIAFGETSYVSSCHLNKDNSVYIGGNFLTPYGNHIDVFPSMGKIFLNGKPDTTFGKTGKIWMDFISGIFSLASTKHTAGGEINDIVLLKDGKILICGGYLFSYTYEGFIARLNPDGTMDKTFNTKGYIRYDFTPGKFNTIQKMLLYDENTVIFGANSHTDFDSDFYFGKLNLTNNKVEVSRLDFKGQHDILEDLSINNGEVILSGRSVLPEHVAKHFRGDFSVVGRMKDIKNPTEFEQVIVPLDKENQNGIMAHAVLDKRIVVAGFVHTSSVYVKDVVVGCLKMK